MPVGFAGIASVAQERRVLELVDGVLGDLDPVDVDPVLVELHEVEAAEHGRILILFTALETDLLSLELVRQLGHLHARELDALPLAHCCYDGNYDGR